MVCVAPLNELLDIYWALRFSDNESKKKQRQTMGPKKAAKFKKRLGSFKTAEGEKGKLGDTS